MNKKFTKNDLLVILSDIIDKKLSPEGKLNKIKKFQNIMWGDDVNKEDLYILTPEESEIMLDLALDLDFYGVRIDKKDKESGIKDIEKNNAELTSLLMESFQKLEKT